MRKIYLASLLTLLTSGVNAGLITHTDYTSGAVISATGQNANENTMFTEFNGNIESANIKDGTIVNADISGSAAIGFTKLDAPTQSSSTYVFSTVGFMASYRRPTLQWVDRITVDIENNTGTANQTCVIFPDSERRCVTENTGSTSVNRRAILTETASTSGTKNSGLRVNNNLTNNSWYSFYIVKSADTSDFVIIADTITPVQANFATLNTNFGTNSWVYVGVLPYGNWADNQRSIPSFIETGNYTVITGTITMTAVSVSIGQGVSLSSAPFISGSSNWTYAAGFDLSLHQIPNQITVGNVIVNSQGNGGTTIRSLSDKTNSAQFSYIGLSAGNNIIDTYITSVHGVPLTHGLTVGGTSTGGGAGVYLMGYYDNVLGIGFNPQL